MSETVGGWMHGSAVLILRGDDGRGDGVFAEEVGTSAAGKDGELRFELEGPLALSGYGVDGRPRIVVVP